MALHFLAEKLRPQARGASGIKTMDPERGSLVGMSVIPTPVCAEEQEGEEDSDVGGEDAAEEEGDDAAFNQGATSMTEKQTLLLLTAKVGGCQSASGYLNQLLCCCWLIVGLIFSCRDLVKGFR